MLILAFDTTMSACSAAVYDSAAQRLLASHQVVMEKGHAEALAPMVQRVLSDAAVAPQQLRRIAVTTGPGTFTGQRIGLALAHGMGTALHCEVVGLDTLTATAAPLLPASNRLCVVHQAGGTGKFYSARFSNGALSGDIEFAGLNDVLAQADTQRQPVVGTGADALVAAAPDTFERVSGHDLPLAAAFVQHAAMLPDSTVFPQPLYLREPDAKPSAALRPISIRPATAEDVVALAKLHLICFAENWNEETFRSALSHPGGGALLVEIDGVVRAFIQYRAAADEAEIITLCSEPRWRRRALAEKLVGGLLHLLRAQSIQKLHLEVAADNLAAAALYRKLGFAETGRRKGYYPRKGSAPVDAIIMSISP
jgi:tRNA threonylcarbamoyl adenosine modification protein YeaZ